MATIPIGNFGQAVASPGPRVALQGGDPIGQAMERTGQVAAGVVNDMAARQTELDQQAQRAKAALALQTASNALHDTHDQVAASVADGSVAPDKAPAEFRSRAAKAVQPMLDGWGPEQRAIMDTHLAQISGTLDRSIVAVGQKRTREDTAAAIDSFGEQVQRDAARIGPAAAASKYGGFVDFTAQAAGINPAQAAKLKQSFSERVHANFFEAAGVAALTKGDEGALRMLREQVAGPGGEALDPARRSVLQHQFFGWEQHILAQRERAANAAETEARQRYNDAADVYNKATDLALGGGYLSPDFITELVTKAQGTDMQKPVENLIASQRMVAGFASLPADQRAAQIERARAERATPGQGTDPLGEKLLSAMVAMDGKLRQQAAENPWAAAQQAGVIQNAQTFNAADPATAVQVLQARMGMIGKVEAWTGAKASPLQPAEAEQVAKMLRALPIDQAGSMLARMGAVVGDADRVAALGKQLHDQDGALGLAMMYANAKTTEGRTTAELILRGDQALKDNTAMVDKAQATGWKADIAKQIRGVYNNRMVEDATVDAAYKIAAALYAKGDGADVDRAVRLATGGIVERNGARVPLPYGMDEKTFGQKIDGITADMLAPQAPGGQVFVGRTPIPLAQFVATLPKAQLQHAGQGLYAVRAGAGVVTNAQGAPLVLKVGP